MRILVLGGGGPVGRAVLKLLVRQGHTVRLATPANALRLLTRGSRPEVLVGDIRRPAQWLSAVSNCEVVLFLPETHLSDAALERAYGLVPRLLESARRGKVRTQRIVLLSSLGAAEDSGYRHQVAAWQAEAHVRASGLEHVILRSGPIWDGEEGPGRPFVRFAGWWGRIPLMGLPGDLFQPVALPNLAEGIVKGVRIPHRAAHSFDVSGPRIYTMHHWAEILAKALGNPSLQPWYVHENSMLRKVLAHARRVTPPWLIARTCNPESYFRTLCVRPMRLDSDARTAAGPMLRPHSEPTFR